MEDSFFQMHQGRMEEAGFWDEKTPNFIYRSIENRYKTEIIRNWCVFDFTMNGDKVLFKWKKRSKLLSDEELNKRYGRKI